MPPVVGKLGCIGVSIVAIAGWGCSAANRHAARVASCNTQSAKAAKASTENAIQVPAGASLQAALDQAQPGDTLLLEPGASYGPVVLRKKVSTSTDFITIRTSDLAALPPSGTRITRDAVLPRILSPGTDQTAVTTEAGAAYYRFVGVEFGYAPSTTHLYALVNLGSDTQTSVAQAPHHLEFERILVKGSDTVPIRRGFALNSAQTSIVDSWIDGINEPGSDSQALCGWNGPGPFTIVNNHIEAASENIMFGGSPSLAPELIPSDILVERNHIFKPLRWQGANGMGGGRVVKNLFELKNARRVVVRGNLLENTWPDGQGGTAVLFTVRAENKTWHTVSDVLFENNKVIGAWGGVAILATDDVSGSVTVESRNIIIRNNFFDLRAGAGGRLFQVANGGQNVVFEHNTALNQGNTTHMYGTVPTHGLRIVNNVVQHHNYGFWHEYAWNIQFPDGVVEKNVVINNLGISADGLIIQNPAANWVVAPAEVGFVNPAGGDFKLSSSSPYRAAASDGKDVGADFAAIEAAMNGPSSPNYPTDPNDGIQPCI